MDQLFLPLYHLFQGAELVLQSTAQYRQSAKSKVGYVSSLIPRYSFRTHQSFFTPKADFLPVQSVLLTMHTNWLCKKSTSGSSTYEWTKYRRIFISGKEILSQSESVIQYLLIEDREKKNTSHRTFEGGNTVHAKDARNLAIFSHFCGAFLPN